MTAPQYYFPYFFDPELINPLFSGHNLELQVSIDPVSKTLHGSGMHIPDFSVKLENIHR